VIQTEITVVQKETIGPAWWRVTLAAPDLAARLQPGQFLFLRCADSFTFYLRRPIFPIPLDQDHLALLIRPEADPGRAWLATRQPEDRLDVIGPLGAGFPFDAHIRNLLLVSDSQAIGPLLGQMERAVAGGVSVTLALGGSRAAKLYPVSLLPPAVEVQLATQNGSLGQRGPVTDLLPDLLRWADRVCACGTNSLYRTLQRQTAEIRLAASQPGFLYGLALPGPLACGVGACYGCSLETRSGLKLACIDGPVFDLMTLEL
jgi:dihydroorotate dehydrogenase electron transfer subunit